MCAHGRKSGAVLLDDKVAILVDGAFYRRRAYHLFGDKPPKDRAEELVAYCTRHLTVSGYRSRLYRIFYYDCPPLSTNLYHPLHKRAIDMKKTETYKWSNDFYAELANKRKVALRMGKIQEQESCDYFHPEIRDCDVCRAANNDMGCEDQRTMELQARVKKLVETGGLQ